MAAVDFAGASASWAEQFVSRDQSGELNIQLTMELLPRSDITSAQAIIARWPKMISYGTQTGQWYLWDGMVHRPSNSGDVGRLVHEWAWTLKAALDQVQDHYELMAASAPDLASADRIRKAYRDQWKLHRAYRDRVFNDAGQNAIIGQLKRLCAVDESGFDAETRWFVVENGVIDLDVVMKTGNVTLLPHDPSRMVTMRSNVVWDENAVSRWWKWYIERSLPDPEVRSYLQRWVGAAMLGKPADKGVVNLIGPPDSGKSVFLETLLNIFGDYSRMVRSQTFLAKRGNDASYDLHEIKGARVVTASEPGAGKKIDDDMVKTLTGNDRQRSREPYGRFVEWQPQCTIFIASNQPMRFDTGDTALLQRIKPIEFPKSFKRDQNAPPGERAELMLGEYLSLERAGVFRWVVDGLLAYRNERLDVEPRAVTEMRSRMAVEIDNPLQWLQEEMEKGHILHDPTLQAIKCIKVERAYSRYQSWCISAGLEREIYTRPRFSGVIGRLYPRKISAGTRFVGLRWSDQLYEQYDR